MQIFWLLFREFFLIGLCTIGGGMAMIPVIENVFVQKHKRLTETDIVEMVGITQTIPGLIAVNCAVFVGHKLAGYKGSLCAVLGVILPSMVIMTLIALFFPLQQLDNEHIAKAFNCMRACVLGMFIMLALKIAKDVLKSYYDAALLLAFTGLLFIGLHPALIVLITLFFAGIYEMYVRAKIIRGKK